MVPLDRLEQITQRFEYIEAQMMQGGGPGLSLNDS